MSSSKLPPPKPPRVRKTLSVPMDCSNIDDHPDSPLLRTTTEGNFKYPSTSSYKSNGKPTISSSMAAANIISVLKNTSALEKKTAKRIPTENLHENSDEVFTDFVNNSRSSDSQRKRQSSYLVVERDPSYRVTRPVSMFGTSSSGETSTGLGNVTDVITRKYPMLPPNRVSSVVPIKPRSPSRLPSQKEDEIEDVFSDSSSKPLPLPRTKSPSSPNKKPLLPPTNSINQSSLISSKLIPPPKLFSMSGSDECRTQSESQDFPPTSQKPIPLPRKKVLDNHMIAPEESHNPLIVDNGIHSNNTNTLIDEEEAGLEMEHNVNSNLIPVSPSSISSGIPEDSPDILSPNFSESRGTTPSCILTNDSTHEEVDSTLSTDTQDEIDGGICKTSRPPEIQKHACKETPKKPQASWNQPKVVLKDPNFWIQKSRGEDTPPTSPKDYIDGPSPSTFSQIPQPVPFRSNAILPEKRSTVMNSVLNDLTKPVIGPSGQYFPPAVRSMTPDPRDHLTVSMPIRKTHSNERILVVNKEESFVPSDNIPSRYKKTRRSRSFSEQKLRPISMMDTIHVVKQEEDDNVSSGTFTPGMGELAKEQIKQKKGRKGSTPYTSGGKTTQDVKKGMISRLFTRNRSVVETETGSSSDDETGGTIKRMPMNPSFPRRSWLKQPSTEPGDDEYVPEYHQLFEYVFVLGLKEDRSAKKLVTEITYRFPPASGEINKDDALRSVDQFCFPDIEQWKPVVRYRSESYSFVLTSMDGNRRFGYCRRLLPNGKDPRLPEVYCIISPLGCFDLYAKILDYVEQRRAVSRAAVFSFLKSIIANPFPAPGRSVSIKVLPARDGDLEVVKLTRPPDSRLEHVDFAELYNTLGPKKLIQVFSSLLMERRVILAAHRLSTLSSCCHALLALLYPFEWQHTFIPVLPNSLIDFCGSPLPFIIGISPLMVKQLDKLDIEMEEALVVDLDKRSFVKKFGDETSILPSKLFQYLTNKLEASVIKTEYSKPLSERTGQTRADQVIVNSFMTVFAYLFGEYRSFLSAIDPATGERKLQKADFLKSFHSKSTRRFLDAFLLTQMFDKFIEERENPLKFTVVAEGLFEKRLPEFTKRIQEIELFSTKRKFPWTKKKTNNDI